MVKTVYSTAKIGETNEKSIAFSGRNVKTVFQERIIHFHLIHTCRQHAQNAMKTLTVENNSKKIRFYFLHKICIYDDGLVGLDGHTGHKLVVHLNATTDAELSDS